MRPIPPPMSTLFVSSMCAAVDANALVAMFSRCGTILSIHMLRNENGDTLGCCFLQFATKEGACEAMKLNGVEMYGASLRLDYVQVCCAEEERWMLEIRRRLGLWDEMQAREEYRAPILAPPQAHSAPETSTASGPTPPQSDSAPATVPPNVVCSHCGSVVPQLMMPYHEASCAQRAPSYEPASSGQPIATSQMQQQHLRFLSC